MAWEHGESGFRRAVDVSGDLVGLVWRRVWVMRRHSPDLLIQIRIRVF